jgi:hypothetical protein
MFIDIARSAAMSRQIPVPPEHERQKIQETQSDHSISQGEEPPEDENPFSVAEEVSFDQQSGRAKHIGNLDEEPAGAGQQGQENATDAADALKKSVERSVPPSP